VVASESQFNILIIDDNAAEGKELQQILTGQGYGSVKVTPDSQQGLECLLAGWPDLVLLDLHMPAPTGFDILRRLRLSFGTTLACPILALTADATRLARREALQRGVSDFLAKPADTDEILLRIKHFLELRKLQKDLEYANRTLEEKVRDRTQELWEANVEVANRLARAAEYRDDQTGQHIQRVADLTWRIALQLGMPEDQSGLIRLAAPLHDVGKIAIPDAILLKPGPLSKGERETMKRHTIIGGGILAHGKSEILRIAEMIAVSHHERWDGTGYPFGLRGDAIPLVGRILAVADVFDALISERPYKTAWPKERALDEIRSCSGSQFDPQVVEAASVVLQDFPTVALSGRTVSTAERR
jgi:putative two-component system response regulator